MGFGIEREMLVFDEGFNPVNFKEDETECCVTLDFADNQLEIVSPTFENIETCYNFVNNKVLNITRGNHYIWPYSYIGNFNYDISIEGMNDESKRNYRRHLKETYDNSLLLTSGIHINYSSSKDRSPEFYFELMQKIYAYAPLLIKLFGYTPFVDNDNLANGLDKTFVNYGQKYSLSLRNSCRYGYRNEDILDINFNSLEEYRNSIQLMIDKDLIKSEKECYTLAKLKPTIDNVKYIELRMIDINPYYSSGLNKKYLNLLEQFLLYLEDIELKEFDYELSLYNAELTCIEGNNENLELKINGVKDTLINHLNRISNLLIDRDINIEKLDSKKIYQELKYESVTDYFLNREVNTFVLDPEYSDLELSTTLLIKEALKYNIKVDILDRTKNVILLDDKELIFEATKTSLDSYSTVLLMEDKNLTKKFLNKVGIKTPNSITFDNNLDYIFKSYQNKEIVIKPTDTNFGKGITVIVNNEIDKLDRAIKYASKFSNNIIVEEFISGEEFRFMVIDEKVISVVKREPANIIGDAKSTIRELIAIKNKSSLRGDSYTYPLINIEIDQVVIDLLKEQNLNLDSVLCKGQKVNLRLNSNISTGGDSIEVSEVINEYYKDIAVKAAKAMNATICGIDMIIPDLFNNPRDYSIIEANFNPAIHIHAYPAFGDGKNVAKEILKSLSLI